MLAAGPILERVNWAWSEAEASIQESKAGWEVDQETGERKRRVSDLKARASLLNVARGLIETEAKARMHPGFVASAGTVNVNDNRHVVVMPRPGELPAPAVDAEVIDVKAVE